jgi:23S rRNA G2069 N7-methylase RlmK/C1962 C5-methylase RlmI
LRDSQALHHLTVNALGLLQPGGRLAVSLCTYYLLGVAEDIIRIAGAQRGQRLWVREQWPQAEDHPWILQIPATRYLTTWWLELDAQSADSTTS